MDGTWVLRRVQERLAAYGAWDRVSVSDSEVELGQLLFQIQRGGHALVFAVPVEPDSPEAVDVLVDRAVAQLGSRENGA